MTEVLCANKTNQRLMSTTLQFTTYTPLHKVHVYCLYVSDAHTDALH